MGIYSIKNCFSLPAMMAGTMAVMMTLLPSYSVLRTFASW